jgi:iron complex outermembrane receptor protein
LIAVSPAFSQAPADTPQASGEQEPMNEITVTGFRESLESALSIKRDSVQVVDSVVAEDIGKLPDLSVAETSARIPGIQVIRQAGEASRVLVRGLPDFSTTYNGREIFTAETRVVALQDFPSSNIASLEVFKTSTADLVEPGLAGLVNVRSRRPFDFKGFEFSGSAWGLYTKQGNEFTPNFNLLATDRWETGVGDIGVLLNVSYTEMQYLDSEPSNTDFIADPTINGGVARLPDIQRLFYRSGNRERPSANAAIQWQVMPQLELYAEALYQGFRNQVDDRQLEVPLYGGASYSNLVFRDGTNLVRSGTVTDPGGNIFTFQGGTYNRTDTKQYAVGARWESGAIKATLDVARTDTTFRGSTESVDRNYSGPRTVDFNLDRPEFTVNGLDLSDPSVYGFQGLYEENQRATGKDWQARADVTWTLSDQGFLRSLQFGVRTTDRDAARVFGNRYGSFIGTEPDATDLPVTFASTNPGFRGTNVQSGLRSFSAPTYDSIRGSLVELRQFVIDRGPTGGFNLPYTTTAVTALPVFDATEKTRAAYAQLNVGFSSAVDGTVGVRGVRTEVDVTGGTPTDIPGFDGGNEFTDWLPNASVRWHLTPQLQMRLSYAETRTKPGFADLAPGTLGAPQTDTNGETFRAGTSGNPLLQPFTSDNFDLSIEQYFSRSAFASAAVFRRDLDGFIQTRETRFTDPDLGNLRVTSPFNTGKGRIEGVELQGQTFLDFLPAPYDGFGVQANYTYLDAKTDFFDRGEPVTRARILGVSKWSYLLTGLYEKERVSARLSFFKRGPSLETVQNRGDDLYSETATYPGRLDLSLNFNLRDNATIFADWTNITERPFKQSLSSGRNGASEAQYVRFLRFEETTYSIGVRFKL